MDAFKPVGKQLVKVKPVERSLTCLQVSEFAMCLVALLLQPELANLRMFEVKIIFFQEATVSFFKAAGSWRNWHSSPLEQPFLKITIKQHILIFPSQLSVSHKNSSFRSSAWRKSAEVTAQKGPGILAGASRLKCLWPFSQRKKYR